MRAKALLLLLLCVAFTAQSQDLNSIISRAKSEARSRVRSEVNKAENRIRSGNFNYDKTVTITFEKLPTTLDGLKALPEASMDTPYKVVALCMAVLCNYENDREATFEMLDYLCRPNSGTEYEAFHKFISERLRDGKGYKAFAFFEGATPDNNYTPTVPYKIKVSSNSVSFNEKNRARLMVKSGGADSPGPVLLREKPSTGQWFVTQISCLTDIRLPAALDEWR